MQDNPLDEEDQAEPANGDNQDAKMVAIIQQEVAKYMKEKSVPDASYSNF